MCCKACGMNSLLFVAEKPSVAAKLAYFLSGYQDVKPSFQNPYRVFKFVGQIGGVSCNCIVTHCIGHITNYTFCESKQLRPNEYFSAPIAPYPTPLGKYFRQLLKSLASQVDRLVLCLDNDREGEHISYEVVESIALYRKVSIFPAQLPRVRRQDWGAIVSERIPFYAVRMRFNAVNQLEILRAVRSFEPLNPFQVEAVDVRQQLDLRIGFALSNLQMANKSTILEGLSAAEIKRTTLSFGTCYTPTIGLLHYNDCEDDRERAKICLETKNFKFDCEADLLEVMYLYASYIGQLLIEKPYVKIIGESRAFKEPPPNPLNTVNLQKKLAGALSGSYTMKTAETLYTQGLISYPRTETEVFEKGFEFDRILANLKNGHAIPELAAYCAGLRVQKRDFRGKSDHAHPPIHPLRMPASFRDDTERTVFDAVCRAFLASLSPDCEKTTNKYTVEDVDCVCLYTSKTYIIDPGWRVLYGGKPEQVPDVQKSFIENTVSLDLVALPKIAESAETARSEQCLIEKMDHFGIGTDATIAEHIQHVQDRKYVVKQRDKLQPTSAALKIIRLYEQVNFNAVATSFRAGMEAGLRAIEKGDADPGYIYYVSLQFAIQLFKDAERNLRAKAAKSAY